MAEDVSDFLTRRNVVFSIDAVICENGEFVGPDRSNTLLRLTATAEARRDLLQQLNQTLLLSGSDGVHAEVKSRSQLKPDESGDPDLASDKRKHFYQNAQQMFARQLFSELERGGRADSALSSFSSDNQINFHRSGQGQ